MGLISLVYVSAAAQPFDDAALTTLLQKSRSNNLERHITGMLLYRDGSFMQALEGEQDGVEALEAIIRDDPRHTQMTRLLTQELTERQFPEWAMGFRNVGPLERRIGETDFLYRRFDDPAFVNDPTQAQRLLLTFRETTR